MTRIPPDILRDVARTCLKRPHLSSRTIASACDCSAGSVGKIRSAVQVSGITSEEISAFDDPELIKKLFGAPVLQDPRTSRPNWDEVHKLMQEASATLVVIWEDWCKTVDLPISYPHFARLYGVWLGQRSLVLRKIHRAGVNTFVDYAGDTLTIHLQDGTVREACVFIGVLGASNYTFAHLSWTQSVPDWIDAHNRMIAFFGGVTEFIVSDNLKSAVIHAGLKRLQLNRHFREWAEHNNTLVLPAGVYKPKHKAPAEVGVQVGQRHIVFRMKRRKWHSLEEANDELRFLLDRLNARKFAKMPGTRLERFLTIDKPALRPLPETVYEPSELSISRKVGADYHVDFGTNHYSVPYGLAHKRVDMRVSRTTVEIFQEGRRVCSHDRCMGSYKRITTREHMPTEHRHVVDGTPDALLNWATDTGGSTLTVVDKWLERGSNFYQGLIMARGLRNEADAFGAKRIESACGLAIEIKSTTLTGIRKILINGSDLRAKEAPPTPPKIDHPNIRGPGYYAGTGG